MNRFYLFALSFLLGPGFAFAQEELQVEEAEKSKWAKNVEVSTGHVEFRDDIHFAYTAPIYNVEIKEAEKMWRELMKDHARKVKNSKNDIVAFDAVFPRLFDDPVEVHATFNELYTTKGVEVNVAFVREGRAIIPDEMSEAREEAEREVYDLAIELNRGIVGDELDEEEDNLRDLERELESLVKDHENLQKDIEKNESRITSSRSELESLSGELAALQEELSTAQTTNSEPPTSKEEKAIARLQKKIEKTESKIERETASIAEYENAITAARDAIPANEAQQEKLKQSIASQMERVEETRNKFRSVQ